MIKKTMLFMMMMMMMMACGDEEPIAGGDCGYKDYPGTCTGQADGKFTYKGTVEGKEVEHKDNDTGPATLTEGQSQSCTLKYITKGTCTPCMFDIGECGKEAFDAAP